MNTENIGIGCVLVFAFLVVLVVVGVLLWEAALEFNTDTFRATIVKFQVTDGETLIVVEHPDQTTEVLSCRDSLPRGKFNSSDTLRDLEINETYMFKVNSKRVHLLSMYRNILNAEKVQ